MSNEFLDALKGGDSQNIEDSQGSVGNDDNNTHQDPTPKKDTSKSNDPDIGLQLNNLTGIVNQLAGKVDVLSTQQQSTTNQDQDDDLDDDDESGLTPEQIANLAKKSAREEIDSEKHVQLAKKWDKQCDEDFAPYGFTNKSSKFYQEVFHEWQSSGGKSNHSPTAVYDAASRTLTRGLKEGWIRPNEVQDAVRDYNVANATGMGPTPGNPGPKKQMTEEYKYFANRLGIPEKKAKEIHETKAKEQSRRMKLVGGYNG